MPPKPPKPSYETDNLALAPPSQDPICCGTGWDGPRAVAGGIWDRFEWFDGWPVLHLAQESLIACFHSFRAWKIFSDFLCIPCAQICSGFYGRLATSLASASDLSTISPGRMLSLLMSLHRDSIETWRCLRHAPQIKYGRRKWRNGEYQKWPKHDHVWSKEHQMLPCFQHVRSVVLSGGRNFGFSVLSGCRDCGLSFGLVNLQPKILIFTSCFSTHSLRPLFLPCSFGFRV